MTDITDSTFKSISILYRKSHIWLNNGCAQFDLTAAQAVVILIVCDLGVSGPHHQCQGQTHL